ncbi:MAG: alpha/beta fold hydrolase [Deltaproteobacteria bacterium]|nr:MAG: alpha/beta fold hydrolase [Deltaproteobacteria bacterium]
MIAPARIVFCHGLESGPRGRKTEALRAAGFTVEAPDCRGADLATRADQIVEVLRADPRPAVVVGSSYGGAAALLAAARAPGRVAELVLCAPALAALGPIPPPPVPTTILHGTRDDVCPIEASRALARHDGVDLVEVDDDHRLAGSLDRLVDVVRRAAARA